MNQDSNTVYAAAQGREFLRNELAGKSNEYVRRFAGYIDDRETLDLLNYYASLFEDQGEDFLDTQLAKIIIRSAATRTADEAFAVGNVSQLQGMVGLTNNSEDGQQAIVEAAERLADEGAIYLVLGPPGAGKTAFSLDVARTWGALTGGRVLANLSWDGADAKVSDSEALLEEMADHQGQVLQVIDEAGQTLTSRGAEQQVTDEFAKSLKYVRKQQSGDSYAKRGSILCIGHTTGDTAAEIRRLASGAFQKPSRADPGRVRFLESEGGQDGFTESEEYQGVTDTRESYDEHEASHFEVIEEQDDEDQGQTPEEARRQEAVATALRAVKPWDDEEGMNYREAAELTPYSSSWVGDRVKEWRSGQHRELLNEEVPTDA